MAALSFVGSFKRVPRIFSYLTIDRRLYVVRSCSSFITSHLKYLNKISANNARVGSAKMSTFNQHRETDFSSESKNREYKEKRSFDVLIDIAKTTKTLSVDEWNELKEKVVGDSKVLIGNNFESMMMIACCGASNVSLAHSLISYLKQSNLEIHTVTLSKFIRLLAKADGLVDELLLLSLYEQLTARHKLLDSVTAEDLILGLCRTSKWKDSLKYLDMMRLTLRHPTYRALTAVIVKAFESGDYELGWDVITNQLSRLELTFDFKEPILAWIEQCKKASSSRRKEMLTRLLKYLREYDIIVTRGVVESLKYLFESSKWDEWKTEFVKVSRSGICHACKTQLESIDLTNDEYERLRTHFVERVIKGKDVYLKTSPAELERFLNFIRYTAPFSVVMDGLNVAYMMSNKINNTYAYSKQLLQVVQHFKSGDRKVLVLCRNHMKSWPSEIFDQIKRESIMFFADDLSKDDPFLLYAALYSGQGTKFISRDMMRDHLFALRDKQLASYFLKWQKAHQIELTTVLPNGTIYSRPPLSYNPIVQEHENYWHIPFYNEDDDHAKSKLSWMCLKYVGTSMAALSKSKINVKRLLGKK